jgi:hypothetical protein
MALGVALFAMRIPAMTTRLARVERIESRVEFEAGPAANIPARERFYADTRLAR